MTVAAERIAELERLAHVAIEQAEPELSREYVQLAKRIAERHRIALPKTFDRFTCDTCDVYLQPGINARVRLQDGHVVMTCDCGAHSRYPYE